MKKYLITAFLFIFLFPLLAFSQQIHNGHSHNDYLQKEPLTAAISLGFVSVEADVFLWKNDLYLAHTFLGILKKQKLEEVYFKGLQKLIDTNENNQVYPHDEREIYLFIDIKSDGVKAIQQLEKTIAPYQYFLSYVENDSLHKKAVRIIISGKRPKDYIAQMEKRFFFIDGRLSDLENDYHPNLYPIISDNFKKRIGKIQNTEKLKNTVEKCHKENKKIRFWNVKNDEKFWQILNDAQVDLINVDELEKYHNFLNRRAGD